MTPPRRILIIKPSSLGDVTHALPVLHLLRKRYPDAKISWLVAPYCSGLLEGHPELDEVILFDRRRFGTAWKNPSAGLDLIRDFLKGYNADLPVLVAVKAGNKKLLPRLPWKVCSKFMVAALPGAVPWREGSGEGIALASGSKAAQTILAGAGAPAGAAA